MTPANDKIELPFDMQAMFNVLSDTDAGQLIKAIFTYAVNGEETVFYGKAGDMLSGLYAVMKIAIDSKPVKKKKDLSNKKNVSTLKQKYGENNNVLLTDEEYAKLQEKFKEYQKRIDNLSRYITQSGKRYESHYQTILNWARREEESNTPEAVGSFETDEFFNLALKRSYESIGK